MGRNTASYQNPPRPVNPRKPDMSYNSHHHPRLVDRIDWALDAPTFLAAIRAFFCGPRGTPISYGWGL